MRSEKKNSQKRGLQITIEVDDPDVADLFLRFKKREVMPSNAATGLKILTTLLNSQRADLLQVEPSQR